MARPKSEVKRKSFGIRLDVELVKALKHISTDSDKPLNVLVEEGIREVLENYGEKKKK